MKQEVELTTRQKEILDWALEEALKNIEQSESIKSGIVLTGARDLLKADMQASKITAQLCTTLAPNKETSKKTGVSKALIYKVLRDPEYIVLKHQNRANSAKIGVIKRNPNYTCSTGRASVIAAPTCHEVIAQEVKKIRDEQPNLSNKQIKKIVLDLDTVKQFAASTVRNAMISVLPIHGPHHKGSADEHIQKGPPPGMSQQTYDQLESEEQLIERRRIFQQVIEWVSGMEEWQRTTLMKERQKGATYNMALEAKCKDHIRWLAKMLPDSFVKTFENDCDEMELLARVFGDILHDERLARERKRDMASR